MVSERSRLAATESDAPQQCAWADGPAEETLVGKHVAGGCSEEIGDGDLGAGRGRRPSVPRAERRPRARVVREPDSAALGASGVIGINGQGARGLHAASSPFLLDTRPRPAAFARSVGQRRRDLAGEVSVYEARPRGSGAAPLKANNSHRTTTGFWLIVFGVSLQLFRVLHGIHLH